MEKILERNIKRNFLGKPHKEEYIDIIDKKLELLSGENSFKIEEIALIDGKNQDIISPIISCFNSVIYEILMNSYDGIIAKAGDNAYIRVRLYRKNNKFTVFVHDNGVGIMGKEKGCGLLLGGMGKGEDLIREYSTSYYRRYSESGSHAKAELDLNFEQ